MLEKYTIQGTKKLRWGYTTGSCAAAAAKAGTIMLLTGESCKRVKLDTPKGVTLDLEVQAISMGEDAVSCAIKKDGGDDPDITDGIMIYAAVSKIESGIEIEGGEGIGTVTRKGLDQPVGSPAINSVPRKMICTAIEEIMEENDYKGGIRVVISAPEGAVIAKKTYNPKLGIEGGISIIGTSGIVEPMSSQALIDTIRVEIGMLKEEGRKSLLISIGNYSESFLRERFSELLNSSVKCSNFIGEAIDAGLAAGFEAILIVGHVGKLVKLGAGIMNTHSSQADGRMETLVACAALAGVEAGILRQIIGCATVDEALEIFIRHGVYEKTVETLLERINFYLEARVRKEALIGAALFSNKLGIIGCTAHAKAIIRKLEEEKWLIS